MKTLLSLRNIVFMLVVSVFVISLSVVSMHAFQLSINRSESSKDKRGGSPALDLLNDVSNADAQKAYNEQAEAIKGKDPKAAIAALFAPVIEAGQKDGATVDQKNKAAMAQAIQDKLKVSKNEAGVTIGGKATEGLLVKDDDGNVTGAIIGQEVLADLVKAFQSSKDTPLVTKRAIQFRDHEINHALAKNHTLAILEDLASSNQAMGTNVVVRANLSQVNPDQNALVAIVDDVSADKDKLKAQNIGLATDINAALENVKAGTMFLLTTGLLSEDVIEKIKAKSCYVFSTKSAIKASDDNRYENIMLAAAFARQIQVTDVNNDADMTILAEMYEGVNKYLAKKVTKATLIKAVNASKSIKVKKETALQLLQAIALPVAGDIVTDYVGVVTAIMKALGKM